MSNADKARKILCAQIVILFTVVMAGAVSRVDGRAPIRDAFFAVYPGAVGSVLDTVPSRPGHCGVCHYDFTGGGTRNPYGVRLGQVIGTFPNNPSGRQQAVISIQNEDSDGDGFTTLVEVSDVTNYVNTPTFPGLTPADIGSVSSVNVAEIQNHLVPTTGSDTTPPSVTVLSPNGGELLVANTSALVTWIATDASGIASIDIYLSDDNGASYRPVAVGLSNSGSHTWFPPNRPTMQAFVRVVATDNASNVGHDVSDGVFSIASPPGGIAPTTLRDFDLPGTQPFETSAISNPATCSVCHGFYDSAVEPYFNWQGSMMAQASRDLLFEACMAIANQDAPDSGDLCLRCHIPNGWLRGRSIPTDGSQMLASDMHGVSCDLCHRLVDPIYDAQSNPLEDAGILANLTMPPDEFGNGMFVIDPTGMRRGPFADATSGHAILVSPFHREAALCGTCHDVSNPAFQRDEEGRYRPNDFDTPSADMSAQTLMPIERTYSEWFYSEYNTPQGVYAPQFGGNRDYVASCQDCHMRAVTGKGCNNPAAPTRNDLPLHDMTGGSTWLPGLLPSLYPGQVNPTAMAAGIARARYMLQNAAEMIVEQEDNWLKVTVINNTGHKLPTGYPEGRRMWLNVRFFDESMTDMWTSGDYDPDTGELTRDAYARVYEAKPGLDEDTAALVGVDPGPSFHFVLNNKIYKDNRIPPRGFVNADFALFGGEPVGHSYDDGQYWDEALYPVPPGAISAAVTLYYQSTSKEYVEFLRNENTTNTKGQELYDLWNNNGKCPPEMMRTETLTVSYVPVAGDINGDGLMNEEDRLLFIAVLLDLEKDPVYVTRCDLNGDEETNGEDIQLFVELLSAG
jgi:hypothetical protein